MFNSKRSKKILFVYFILLFLGVITSIFFLRLNSYKIFPINNLSIYEIGTFHEEMDSNFTHTKFDIVNDKIVFEYTLSKYREEPFGAFYFRDEKFENNLLNISPYNTLSIYLKADKAQQIPITLRFKNDLYKNLSKDYPEISLSKIVHYTHEGVYDLALDEFEISAWWLRYHGIEKENIDLEKVKDLRYLSIGSCIALEPGTKDTIVIDSVQFVNSNKKVYLILILYFFLVLTTALIHVKIINSKKIIFVNPLNIQSNTNDGDEKIVLIKKFMAENYQNPDLTFYHLQKATKLSAKEIRDIFTHEFNESFKSYLKLIRIEQIKKALQETNLSISEIAYKCGYNDIPHFNRLFKSETGKSPKEYRKENLQ
jgi:AraC-like DNA-binding protein